MFKKTTCMTVNAKLLIIPFIVTEKLNVLRSVVVAPLEENLVTPNAVCH